MRQIAKNVYYEPSFRGVNIGLIVTKEGVVSIDTPMLPMMAVDRSEERRVGKECRSRWSPYH